MTDDISKMEEQIDLSMAEPLNITQLRNSLKLEDHSDLTLDLVIPNGSHVETKSHSVVQILLSSVDVERLEEGLFSLQEIKKKVVRKLIEDLTKTLL